MFRDLRFKVGILDRTITRHNSVSSSVGSNLYDMVMRPSGANFILNDPRVSCSPPLPGLHSNTVTSNGGSHALGRATCDSSTQTEENLVGFDISVSN